MTMCQQYLPFSEDAFEATRPVWRDDYVEPPPRRRRPGRPHYHRPPPPIDPAAAAAEQARLVAELTAQVLEAMGLTPSPVLTPEMTLLGLTHPFTADDVNRAWRSKAAEAHPDRGGSDAKFIELTRARDAVLTQIGAVR